MSAFGIWAIILTGIYIIYYPVVICLDLFGKQGQRKDGEEVFDTGAGEGDGSVDADEETPTNVYETENGYRVGDELAGDEEEESPQVVEDPAPAPLTPEQQRDAEFKDMNERIKETLENKAQVVIPEYQQTLDADSFLMAMSQPMNKKSRIKRHVLY